MKNQHWRQDYPPGTSSSVTEGSDDDDVFDEMIPGTDATNDSGYSSSQEEEEENNGTGTGSSSDTDETISSSGASDEEDVDDRIQYLHEKQQILKRAVAVLSSEEAYEAATALETAKLTHASIPPSATWNEAMSMLRSFGYSPSMTNMASLGTSSSSNTPRRPSSRMSGKKRKNCDTTNNDDDDSSPRNPSINVSTVGLLSSVSYLQEQQHSSSSSITTTEQIKTQDDRVLELLSSMSPSIFRRGQWMAQALVRSAPLPLQHKVHPVESEYSSSASSSSSIPPETLCATVNHQCWKMVSNPRTHTLGLAPPFGTSFMDHAIDIQQAMALTSQPRVLTQATPPFSIVYANRAFLCLQVMTKDGDDGDDDSDHGGGRDDVASSSSLIGRPIESIIQLVLDDNFNHNKKHDDNNKKTEAVSQQQQQQQHDTHYLNGLFPLKNSEACRIQVFPVIDRSRRRRVSDDDDDDDNENSNNNHDYYYASSMSHILVEVSPQVDEPQLHLFTRVDDMEAQKKRRKSNHHQQQQQPRRLWLKQSGKQRE